MMSLNVKNDYSREIREHRSQMKTRNSVTNFEIDLCERLVL